MSDWIKEGLRFKCTQCGKCCTGGPGYVWVTLEEMEKIAATLNLSLEAFTKRYVRKVHTRFSLIEKKPNYDCVFLQDKQCTIYESRPKQCRTFPWWDENLSSEKAWKECSQQCEGINEEAPLVTLASIEKQRREG
jgi:Fe-S-cluster containining protein